MGSLIKIILLGLSNIIADKELALQVVVTDFIPSNLSGHKDKIIWSV